MTIVWSAVVSAGIGAAQDERLPGAGQRLGRAEVDEAAVVDHDQPVADLLQLAQQVRGHEDRPSALGDFTDQAADVLHADWIESVGRFVEDDQLGVSEQRGGDAETLLHAHRVGTDAVAAAAGEADEVDEIGDVLLGVLTEHRQGPQVVDPRRSRDGRRATRSGRRRG